MGILMDRLRQPRKQMTDSAIDMVVITGQRAFADRKLIWTALDKLNPSIVVEGEAPGADRMAADWALSRGRQVVRVPAPWKTHGKASGSIRNRWMLEIGQREADNGHKVCVLYFLDELKYGRSYGTINCLKQADQDFDLPICNGVSLILDEESYLTWLTMSDPPF